MKKTSIFDSGMKLPPENRIHLFDPVGLINENYGGYNAIKQRRATKSYESLPTSTNGGGLRFDTGMIDDESPRLWKSSLPSSPNAMKDSSPPNTFQPTSPRAMTVTSTPHPFQPTTPPHHFQTSTAPHAIQPTGPKVMTMTSTPRPLQPAPIDVHNLSPTSRTQAIARGRRELMDMIKDMPESFYELSLKDIVEHKQAITDHVQNEQNNNNKVSSEETTIATDDKTEKTKEKQAIKKNKKMKKSESRLKMVRSASIDNGGFLLKTSVFPISFGTKNKKNLAGAASFKVAPKPQPPTTSYGSSAKVSDKDWWRKKPCIPNESDSGGLSSNSGKRSGSSTSRSNNGRSNTTRKLRPRLKTILFCIIAKAK